MENPMLTKWAGEALKVTEAPRRVAMPLHVLSGEAVDVARFFELHWQSERDAQGRLRRPGLELVARAGLFHAELGREILELQEAVQAAQTRFLLAVSPTDSNAVERAELVLREITATLEFMLDDGAQDVDDARLMALLETHRGVGSQDALAAALDDFAGFAELKREAMAGLGGFDVAMIDEARVLAMRVRELSARKLFASQPNEQKQARDLRDRLVAMLYDRMQRVRAAARFVFRNDPSTVRKATSTYQRTRRARVRRAAEVAVEGSSRAPEPQEPETNSLR